MTLLDKIKKGIISGFHTASDLTLEYTRIGRIKIDILGVKREIEEKMLELGGRVYHLYEDPSIGVPIRDPMIRHLLEQLRELESELKKLEEKLNHIRQMEHEVVKQK